MKPFKILDAKEIKYICLYHNLYAQDMKNLDDSFKKAGVSYGIKIGKSENIQMNNENVDEWIKTIRAKLETKQFNFVFILLDDYLQIEGFYSPLKKHSLETMGYPMQVILTNSLYKNTMSVVSNILLQANSKLGGSLFKIQIPKEIKNKNLMVVGIDISSLKGQNKLNIAMCATTNPDLTEYYNSNNLIPIEYDDNFNRNLCFNVSAFIHEAVMEFFKKNKNLPKGVIIYRQGVSKEQRAYLSDEVLNVEKMLSGNSINQQEKEIYSANPIPYYYILVNKKTSLKFFEKEKMYGKYEYSNPECGLLILNDLTETENFEFYVQPQKVNQGTATPTNFHVAYGNLNMPDYIPKITYDLCYMYSNWRGPVRVPAPLKYAEKLAKCGLNLHKNSKIKLYHL